MSRQYTEHARSAEGREWEAPHPYVEGVRVTWRGIKLVCTRGHYCGGNAVHPWDPGSGWDPEHGATLWAPDGPREVAKIVETMAHFIVEHGAQVLEDDEYAAVPLEQRHGPTFSAVWLRKVVVEIVRRTGPRR